MSKRALSMLSLAMKAGKIKCGDFAVKQSADRKRAMLVVLDTLSSQSTKNRWYRVCEFNGIPCIELEHLGNAVGKPGRMVLAIESKNFADMVCAALDD